jgi:hypothetical protein
MLFICRNNLAGLDISTKKMVIRIEKKSVLGQISGMECSE